MPVEPKLVLNHKEHVILYGCRGDKFVPEWTEKYQYSAEKRLLRLTMAYSGLHASDEDIISGIYTASNNDVNFTNFSAKRLAELRGYDYCLSLPRPKEEKKERDRHVKIYRGMLSQSDMERADISFVLNGFYYRAHVGILYPHCRLMSDGNRFTVSNDGYADASTVLKYSTKIFGIDGTEIDGLYLENRYIHRIVVRMVNNDKSKGNIMSFERMD